MMMGDEWLWLSRGCGCGEISGRSSVREPENASEVAVLVEEGEVGKKSMMFLGWPLGEGAKPLLP